MDSIDSSQRVGPSGDMSCSRKRPQFSLQWNCVHSVGAGLANMGNTCFLNAVLQCLSYTAPLANYMLSGDHSRSCNMDESCMMCTMQNHISKVYSNTGKVIMPTAVLEDLTQIAPDYQLGSQEDAHEFLVHIVNAMQESCYLTNILNQQTEDTLIHQIFRGQMRSRVVCSSCQETSDTLEPFMDILLPIENTQTITAALENFVKPETLDSYNCSKCKKLVQASKGVTINSCSNVITITLLRFANHNGDKINQNVIYPKNLDMSPYMSECNGEPHCYSLYAVLVHAGSDCYSGHYYCYVKASNRKWYKMNDSLVSRRRVRTVLKKKAYILFYIRSPEPTKDDCIPRDPPPVIPNSWCSEGPHWMNKLQIQPDEDTESKELTHKRWRRILKEKGCEHNRVRSFPRHKKKSSLHSPFFTQDLELMDQQAEQYHLRYSSLFTSFSNYVI